MKIRIEVCVFKKKEIKDDYGYDFYDCMHM